MHPWHEAGLVSLVEETDALNALATVGIRGAISVRVAAQRALAASTERIANSTRGCRGDPSRRVHGAIRVFDALRGAERPLDANIRRKGDRDLIGQAASQRAAIMLIVGGYLRQDVSFSGLLSSAVRPVCPRLYLASLARAAPHTRRAKQGALATSRAVGMVSEHRTSTLVCHALGVVAIVPIQRDLEGSGGLASGKEHILR